MKHMLSINLIFTFTLISIAGHSQTTWKTFKHKNGYVIQLPNYFSTGLLVAAGTLQWYDNTLDKNIQLTVESFGNGGVSDSAFQFEYISAQSTFKTITYKVIKPTWFVITGEEEDDELGIGYEKTIIRNGNQYNLRISYPKNKQALLNTIIPRISASFK